MESRRYMIILPNERLRNSQLREKRPQTSIETQREVTSVQTEHNVIFAVTQGKQSQSFIEIYNKKTRERLQVLSGHASVISSLVAENGKLYTSSVDRTIFVWNLEQQDVFEFSLKLLTMTRCHRSFNNAWREIH